MATSQEGEMPVLLGDPSRAFNALTSGDAKDALCFVEPKSNAEIAPCLSVVMPVYNEESTVARIVRSVLEQRPVQDLIIVDDCSTDRTWQVLKELADQRMKLLRHEKNQGKGAALR